MASSTRSLTRRPAGLPSSPRSQLLDSSSSQTSAPKSRSSRNINHARLKKSEEYNKGELVRVDQRLSTSSQQDGSEQYESGRNIFRNERVMTKSSGDNNLIPSRVAEVATVLTQEVSKMWSFKIPTLGISSNDEEPESDLTKAMRAYHLSKACEPSDLPAWLFTDTERGGGGFLRSESLTTGSIQAKQITQPELERRNLNLTRRDIYQTRVDRSKVLKSTTDNASRLRIDSRR